MQCLFITEDHMNNGKMKQTRMAEALDKARVQFTEKGGNPGRVGHRIINNLAQAGLLKSVPAQRKGTTS